MLLHLNLTLFLKSAFSNFKFINIKLVHFLSDSQQQEGIHASTDTCWQKKGSGRAYNSLSGLF